MRALERNEPANPEAVARYLESKFGEALAPMRRAMEKLARSLYDQFRPTIPAGQKGWGAKGELDRATILALVERRAGR